MFVPINLVLEKAKELEFDSLLRQLEAMQLETIAIGFKKSSENPEGKLENRREISNAITRRDAGGYTPLLRACMTINSPAAVRLIKLDDKGATINMPDLSNNRTPLHIACILGLDSVVRILFSKGVKIKCFDKYHHEPFYYLMCSDFEKRKYIDGVLESINFFKDYLIVEEIGKGESCESLIQPGDGQSQKAMVIEQVLVNNNKLRDNMSMELSSYKCDVAETILVQSTIDCKYW